MSDTRWEVTNHSGRTEVRRGGELVGFYSNDLRAEAVGEWWHLLLERLSTPVYVCDAHGVRLDEAGRCVDVVNGRNVWHRPDPIDWRSEGE
jgi:hypothetical protein